MVSHLPFLATSQSYNLPFSCVGKEGCYDWLANRHHFTRQLVDYKLDG